MNSKDNRRLTALVLAAGSSSRMGQSKQMLVIDGDSLLTRTVRTILKAGISDVVVVLGADEEAHRALLKGLAVDVVHNPDWKKGMGGSLKAGLHHLMSQDNPPHALIVSVCDQPLLAAEHISNLFKKYEETGRPMIASRYSGKPGVPALFDHTCFNKLETLGDDQGAKSLMLQNPGDVAEVNFPGGEVDLDTMEDYETFVNRES